MHTGPNLNIDSLVFGYDNGYPMVSSTKDSYKFNLGQPTENLIGRFVNHYSDSDYWVKATNYYLVETIVQKQADSSAPGGYYTRVKGNTDPGSNSQIFWNGGNIGIGQGSGDIDEFGEQVTVSAYLKGSGNVKLQAYDNNTGYKQGSNITLTDEWTYYSFSTTFGDGASNGSHWVGVREIGSGSGGIDDVYVAKLQWERKTNATPYIQGTRTSTGALIDLKRTNDIDVSNASFDSNAQLEFDGTDDFVRIPYTATDLDGDPLFSVEAVVKRTGTLSNSGFWGIGGDSSLKGINSYVHGAGANKITIDLWGTATFRTSVDYPLNEYIHVVWVKKDQGFSTSTIVIYINGVAYTGNDFTVIRGSSHTPNLNTSTSGKGLTIGRVGPATSLYHGSVELPLIKFYNDALSAEKVKEHFNAIRNRFEI